MLINLKNCPNDLSCLTLLFDKVATNSQPSIKVFSSNSSTRWERERVSGHHKVEADSQPSFLKGEGYFLLVFIF